MKDADWTDQDWGNKKATLFLSLYRKDALVHQENIFGTYDRTDTQKYKSYQASDKIVYMA